MKAKKRRMERFIFYDYNGIAAHLEKMAASGWMLEEITSLFWVYRRIEPADFKFTVTYFSEASEFNPYPTENQQVFLDYCEKAGWTLVTEWAQMQILCSEMENPVPIETDEAVKLQAIHKSMKKNFIPSSIVMIAVAVLQLITQLIGVWSDLIGWLCDTPRQLLTVCWLLIGLGNVLVLLGYFHWRRKSAKAVDEGDICVEAPAVCRSLNTNLYLVVVICLVIWMIFTISDGVGWVAVITAAAILFLIALLDQLKKYLKKRGISKSANYAVTIVACVAGTLAVLGGMAALLVFGVKENWFSKKPVDIYELEIYNGHTWDWEIYHDELPLIVEDMVETENPHYSYELEEKHSLWLDWTSGSQSAPPDGMESFRLEYEIVDVKFSSLYELCLEKMMEQYEYNADLPYEYWLYWKEIDAALWGADKVYQWCQGDETSYNEYVICWGSRIVRLETDWELDDEQIKTAAGKLGK